MILDLHEIRSRYSLNIKGILHVGGHHGQEQELYDTLKIKNVVYFEPVKSNFEILRQKEKEGLILFNCALGNYEGLVEMNIETNNLGQSSSILEAKIHLEHYPNITFDNKETVEIKMLNNIALDFKKYNLLNIDVQGYELEVLKGSDRILKFIDYIVVEVNKVEMYKNCSLVSEIDNFLYNFGFIRKETFWVDESWGDSFYLKQQKK
jgi:FkbM family methyltransferase